MLISIFMFQFLGKKCHCTFTSFYSLEQNVYWHFLVSVCGKKMPVGTVLFQFVGTKFTAMTN